jgi:hypothetical protein
MRRENLDEAHTLVLNAVQLDPGNLHYRLSTANILLQMQRPTDAIAALQNAASLAKTPDEVSSVENLLEAAQQYQASREQLELPALTQGIQSTGTQGQSSAQATLGAAEQPVSEEPHGPHYGVKGTIRDVQCSLPANMELKVEGDGKTLSLHSNNYFRIQFTAVNFTPEGELHPCTDLEGMKANVEFFEASGKPGDGQIFSIELRK